MLDARADMDDKRAKAADDAGEGDSEEEPETEDDDDTDDMRVDDAPERMNENGKRVHFVASFGALALGAAGGGAPIPPIWGRESIVQI